MNQQEILQQIKRTKVVPVIRTAEKKDALDICEAIIEGGINCLEITMTVPNAVELIAELNEKYQNAMLLGAGTVTDEKTAEACLAAGAKFIVTPYLNLEVIKICRDRQTLICAGALTPTEVFTAWRAGAEVVKVFPVNAMGGAGYLKSLKAPFPMIELMPTGGISLANAAEYLAAGAVAVGVGGELSNPAVLKANGRAEIVRLARQFAEISQ